MHGTIFLHSIERWLEMCEVSKITAQRCGVDDGYVCLCRILAYVDWVDLPLEDIVLTDGLLLSTVRTTDWGSPKNRKAERLQHQYSCLHLGIQ